MTLVKGGAIVSLAASISKKIYKTTPVEFHYDENTGDTTKQ
jgi:hypothetical protein